VVDDSKVVADVSEDDDEDDDDEEATSFFLHPVVADKIKRAAQAVEIKRNDRINFPPDIITYLA
jgi:hypothetical protein